MAQLNQTATVEPGTRALDGQNDAIRVPIPADRRSGALAVSISNMVVRLYRTHTGRGPTKSRASIDTNLIVVELRETLTAGERNLIASGQSDVVFQMRSAFREMMREELIAGLEEVTHRRVGALLSDNHLEPDIAVEVFVLEPETPAVLR